MDPWAVLGVAPGSSDRSIRAAYIRRSKQLHPDLGGTDEAMRDLNAAYEAALSSPPPPAPPPAPPPSDLQPGWFASAPESDPRAGPFAQTAAPPTAAPKLRRPRKRFYKRPIFYVGLIVLVAFVLTSGATEAPSPDTKPAVYGLIGRCVNLFDREIDQVVPCDGPHDAWVVAVVPRIEACPPLATGFVATISHHICVTTEK